VDAAPLEVIQVHVQAPHRATHAERFNAQSGGGQLGLDGLVRHEARVRSASAADADLVARGGAFEVVAEVVAERGSRRRLLREWS
jgi:hypothetical protein